MTKIKVKEGDVFAVPLVQGGYAVGLIARAVKNIAVGYFFSEVWSTMPDVIDGSDFKKRKIVLIARFSSVLIGKQEWPLLKTQHFGFSRNEWPIPAFQMQESLTGNYNAVVYDENLSDTRRHRITKEEADKLYSDGLYGYEALQIEISDILT